MGLWFVEREVVAVVPGVWDGALTGPQAREAGGGVGPARSRGENGWGRSQSLRILGARLGARRRTPSPRVGLPQAHDRVPSRFGDRSARTSGCSSVRTIGPERRLHPLAVDPRGGPRPDGPPERDRGGRVRRAVRSASRRLRPLAPMRSNPLRDRGARSARALTVARGVGQGLSSPRPGFNRSTCFVVAPVVMWAGRRAVQGPGVGRRPSPGRHVHGRVVRGARGGGSSGLGAPDEAGREVLGARSGWRGLLGLPGHAGEKQRESIPIAADPRRRRPARGAAPLRLGWALPPTGRSTGTRRRWSCSSRGPRRVPAAASSRADALERRSADRGARSVRALTLVRRARPGSRPRHGRRRSSAPTGSRPARWWGSRPPSPRAGTPTRRRP